MVLWHGPTTVMYRPRTRKLFTIAGCGIRLKWWWRPLLLDLALTSLMFALYFITQSPRHWMHTTRRAEEPVETELMPIVYCTIAPRYVAERQTSLEGTASLRLVFCYLLSKDVPRYDQVHICELALSNHPCTK